MSVAQRAAFRCGKGKHDMRQLKSSRRKASATAALSGCSICPLAALQLCIEQGQSKKYRDLKVGQIVGVAVSRRPFCLEEEVKSLIPIICSGWAAAYVNLPNGSRQILSFILPGEVPSASLFFSGAEYVWVEAISNVHYRSFNRSDFMRDISGRPETFALIADVWTKEKRRADWLIVDLGRRSAGERIASLLTDLVDRLQQRGLVAPDGSMEFPLRHRHIADATGLTPVHVSKVLSEFRRRGLLTLAERVLTIKDTNALRRSAGQPYLS